MLYVNMLSIAKTVLSSEDAKIINETIYFGDMGEIIFSAVDGSGLVHEIHITDSKRVIVTTVSCVLNQISVDQWSDISENSIPELEHLSHTVSTFEIVSVERIS